MAIPQDQDNTTKPGGENISPSTTGESGSSEYPNEKFLRYPYKRIENDSDYLKIDIIEFSENPLNFENLFVEESSTDGKSVNYSVAPNATFAIKTQSELSKSKTIKHTICLPIPETITDSSSISWGDGGIGPVEAFGVMFGQEFIDKPSDAVTKAIDALSSAGALGIKDEKLRKAITAALSGAAIGSLGGNISGNQLISRATGQVFNPNLELLFDGVGLRNFSFNFEFFPRSKREALEVNRIIRCIKRSMSAKKNASGNSSVKGIFIAAPDIFQLNYMRGSKKHPFLNRFLPMALYDMQLNYTGSNTYSTFWDGTPSHITMTLSFKELNPIYKEDYDELYKDDPTSVGY